MYVSVAWGKCNAIQSELLDLPRFYWAQRSPAAMAGLFRTYARTYYMAQKKCPKSTPMMKMTSANGPWLALNASLK